MREQLSKLNTQDGMNRGLLPPYISTNVGSVGLGAVYHIGSNATSVSRDELEKQLRYISTLAHHMYTEVSNNQHVGFRTKLVCSLVSSVDSFLINTNCPESILGSHCAAMSAKMLSF